MDNSTNLLLYGLIALAIQSIILYFIIQSAVYSAHKKANQDLVDQLKILNQFKVRELTNAGVSAREIQEDIDKVFGNLQIK